MKALSWLICIAASFAAFACSSPHSFSTVVLGLDSVPEEVSSISIFVSDIETEEIVASATVSGGQTTVLLGVPAERALQFTAVAYSLSPGPTNLENMPNFVARSTRTIPLDRDRIRVPLTALKAGVLTLRLSSAVGQSSLPDGLALRLESEADTPSLLPIRIPEGLSRYQQSLVLPVGRYRASLEVTDEDARSYRLQSASGIHVAAELETITQLRLVSDSSEPNVGLSPGKILTLNTDGSTLADSFRLAVNRDLQARLIFSEVDLDLTELRSARWSIRASPLDCLSGPMGMTAGEFDQLDNLSLALTTRGEGRAELMYEFELQDRRVLRRFQNYIVVNEQTQTSDPVELALTLVQPSELAQGTELRIEILDQAGLYARPITGRIDFSESDDWLYFLEGPSLDLDSVPQGVSYRQLSRLSGPAGLPLVVRATLTSTNLPSVLTSTLGIDALSFD